MFPISYRDLELMLLDRGVEVDHTTIFRWIQAYAEELEKPIRPHLRMSNGSWRVIDAHASGIYAMQRFAKTIRQDLEAVRKCYVGALEQRADRRTDQQTEDPQASHAWPRRC